MLWVRIQLYVKYFKESFINYDDPIRLEFNLYGREFLFHTKEIYIYFGPILI